MVQKRSTNQREPNKKWDVEHTSSLFSVIIRGKRHHVTRHIRIHVILPDNDQVLPPRALPVQIQRMSPSGTQDCLFCGRAAMIAAAIACLLQPTSAFISNGVSVSAGSHPGGTEWAPSATHRLRATTPTNHRGAFTAYQHETGRSAVACLRRRSSMLMITAAPAPSPAAASERLSSETSQSLKIGVEITASEAAEASAAATEAATEAATAGAAGGVLDRVKPAVRSISDAKHELLHLFSLSSAGKELTANQEERAGLLLEMLEDNYTPIQTVAFFNLAVQV